MERSFRQYLMAGTMLAGGAAFGGVTPAAANVCPAAGSDTNCGITITLNSNGTATVTASGQGPYDGLEDTLVGIVNNSGGTVNSVTLKSNLTIFGFDGDGVSKFTTPTYSTPAGQSYAGFISPTGAFKLSGTLDSFSGITAGKKSGTLNFPGGLVNGGSAFFSLEEPLTAASFTVKTGVPEPATLSILGRPWPALACYGAGEKRPDRSMRNLCV